MTPRSHSTLPRLSIVLRLREWIGLLGMYARGWFRPLDCSDVIADFNEYDRYVRRYCGKALTQCQVVEIGYGARPRRLLWLAGHGVDVVGVDLDQPVLRGTPAEFFRIAGINGVLRAIKSLARFVIADIRSVQNLRAAIERDTGAPFETPLQRFVVGDASEPGFWRGHSDLDFIYSEDVFEHIPPQDLKRLISLMAGSLRRDGIAFIRPMIFTGICGGHHLEWYGHTLAMPRERRTEPWEHLRRNRYPADTYLNGVTRAGYRELFVKHFEILEERERFPGLGREFLTPAIRAELANYGEDELLSNTVLFVMRLKRSG